MTSDYLKRLGAQGHLKVKQALRRWDPIGVYEGGGDWPDDEYDGYSAPVVRLLDVGAPKEEVMKYLRAVCVNSLEMPFDAAHTAPLVDELLAFWPKWKKEVQQLGPEHILEE